MRRRGKSETPHSRVMHAGDPDEVVYVQHRDGSYSAVQITAVDDDMAVDVRSSTTHETHLKGV